MSEILRDDVAVSEDLDKSRGHRRCVVLPERVERKRKRHNTCATCTTLQATSHSTTQECQGAARRSTAQNGMDVRSLWGEQCTTMARVALCVRTACACSTFYHRAMLGWWMLFCLVWKLNPDFLTTIRFALTETRRTSLNSATLA